MSCDRSLGRIFDDVAEAYDEVREGYPHEIVARAVQRGRLDRGARVLEVGCGTGKLTEELVRFGLHVDAVDPGARMIHTARSRVGAAGEVTFHVQRFEDVVLPLEEFDAVFSATAFHWLDPRVSWQKAASHLKPGGLLALLTHTSVHDERSAAAGEEFRALLREYAPSHAPWPAPRHLDELLDGARRGAGNASKVWDWVMADGRHGLANEDAASLFEAVELTAVVSEAERTAAELQAHFRTTSLYFQIEPGKREAFEEENRLRIDARGGAIHFSSAVVLMTATRVG